MKNLFLVGLVLVSSTAQAGSGNGAGNGGAVIVCRDQPNQIRSARLLDFYNYELLENYVFNTDEISEEQVYRNAKERLIQTQNFFFLDAFIQEWKIVKASWKSLPKGVPVIQANDARLVVGLEEGCAAEYAVNYTVINGTTRVLVNTDIYEKLTSLEKAALKVHESVYAVARKYFKDTTSERTQEITALLTASIRFQSHHSRLTVMTGIALEKERPEYNLLYKASAGFLNAFSENARWSAKQELSFAKGRAMSVYENGVCAKKDYSKKCPKKLREKSDVLYFIASHKEAMIQPDDVFSIDAGAFVKWFEIGTFNLPNIKLNSMNHRPIVFQIWGNLYSELPQTKLQLIHQYFDVEWVDPETKVSYPLSLK